MFVLIIYLNTFQVPRKGGPGVTQSDILVINKTDLAPAVGADLDVMKRDSKRMRGDGPTGNLMSNVFYFHLLQFIFLLKFFHR